MASKLSNLGQTLLRSKGSLRNINRETSTLPKNIREGFEKFQKDDGVPVYLKGGIGDKILFGVTGVIIAYGLAESAVTIYRLDRKK